MNYAGKVIKVGDVVEHIAFEGEWTVDAIYEDNGVMELRGPPPKRTPLAASPGTVKFLRRAPKPPSAPRMKRAKRTDPVERSVALNLGGHLGVARVEDESEDGKSET